MGVGGTAEAQVHTIGSEWESTCSSVGAEAFARRLALLAEGYRRGSLLYSILAVLR